MILKNKITWAAIATSVLATLSLGAILTASAETSFKGGDTVIIEQNQTIDGSSFLAGKRVEVLGNVKGDIYCAAEKVIIKGQIDGDVMCAGSEIDIAGQVDGDARLAAEDINLRAKINGSVLTASSKVTSENNLNIGQDITLLSGEVNLLGQVGRDVISNTSETNISGQVGRDVRGSVTKLKVNDGAKIAGNVDYSGLVKPEIAQNTVAGKVNFYNSKDKEESNSEKAISSYFGGITVVVWWVLFTAIGLIALAPKKLMTITSVSDKKLLLAFAVGLASFVFAPMLIIALVATLVAIPLAIVGFVGYSLICMLALPVAAFYIGRRVSRKRKFDIYIQMMIGIVILGALMFIPLVNIIVFIFSFATGVGLILTAFRGEYEKRFRKKIA